MRGAGRSWRLRLGIGLVVCLAGARSTWAQTVAVCREPWGTGAVRVACLGNSNTESDWQINRPDGFPTEDGWCERLADDVLTSVNCGWSGATALPNVTGEPYFQGEEQVAAALADPLVDVLILAYGTNDLWFGVNNPGHLLADDLTPAGIADQIEALALQAEQSGALVLVGTTPYRLPPEDLSINDLADDLNAELALRFAPESLVDFTTGFVAGDYLNDGLHMSSDGMARRATAARQAVLRLVPEPGPRWSYAALGVVLALRRRAARRGRAV